VIVSKRCSQLEDFPPQAGAITMVDCAGIEFDSACDFIQCTMIFPGDSLPPIQQALNLDEKSRVMLLVQEIKMLTFELQDARIPKGKRCPFFGGGTDHE
jgi:hypothetical protein